MNRWPNPMVNPGSSAPLVCETDYLVRDLADFQARFERPPMWRPPSVSVEGRAGNRRRVARKPRLGRLLPRCALVFICAGVVLENLEPSLAKPFMGQLRGLLSLGNAPCLRFFANVCGGFDCAPKGLKHCIPNLSSAFPYHQVPHCPILTPASIFRTPAPDARFFGRGLVRYRERLPVCNLSFVILYENRHVHSASAKPFEVVFVDRRDLCRRGSDATEFRYSGESKWKHAAKPS
jgi:hypothetical protein